MTQVEQDKRIVDSEERIEALAKWFSVTAPEPINDYEWELYREVQRALLAIPGHANHFKDKIEEFRSKIQSGRLEEEEFGECVRGYRNSQGAIVTLGRLPSAESVAVLGHFVKDSEHRDGKTVTGAPRRGDDGYQTNCLMAMNSFNRIGIASPPVDPSQQVTTGTMYDCVDRWAAWWDEVKAGKRTYRFIGSDIEYGPDGPASVEAVRRNALNHQRDQERQAGRRKTAPATMAVSPSAQSPATLPVWALTVAGLACACAVWVVLNRRKST